MTTFEKEFENLDVQTGVMNDAMGKQAALSTPPDQVNELLHQIADEHKLNVNLELPQAGQVSVAAPAAVEEKNDLQSRLSALKGA